MTMHATAKSDHPVAHALMRLAILLAVALFLGCGDDPVSPGDKTPPTVVSATPAGQGVAVDNPVPAIWVVFSEPIKQSTVTPQSFVITPLPAGAFQFNGDSVGYVLSEPPPFTTTYNVSVTTSVTDLAGNHLAQTYAFSFITEDDPATVPPTVVSTSPINGAINVSADVPITVVFSKAMDASTFTAASVDLGSAAFGSVAVNGATVTITPEAPLAYSTEHTITITTAVADTFGLHPAGNYSWHFTTRADPSLPAADVAWPPDSAIVGDTVTFSLYASAAVETARFFVNGTQVGSTDSTAPYRYLIDASAWEVGGAYRLWATVHDSAGHTGYSDTVTVFYQWEVLATDGNLEELPQDMRRMLWRSTDSALELRYEYAVNWSDPFNDTAVDLGIYFDTDRQVWSGRTTFGEPPREIPLNGIGAERRAILGLHGLEAFAAWNVGQARWDVLFDPTGLYYLNMPHDTNVAEVGIRWSSLGSEAVDIVSINIFYFTPVTFATDWIPNQGAGYITVFKQDNFIGEGYLAPAVKPRSAPHAAAESRPNPFDL